MDSMSLEYVLCKCLMDSHDHLFYDFPLLQQFGEWSKEKGKFRVLVGGWDNTIPLCAGKFKRKGARFVIHHLLIVAFVYRIWQVRNMRLFKGKRQNH